MDQVVVLVMPLQELMVLILVVKEQQTKDMMVVQEEISHMLLFIMDQVAVVLEQDLLRPA